MTDPKRDAAASSIYGLIARDGRSVTVFRRGPSKQVRLVRWWLKDNRIEPGQWLKGRIYERRCDLTPDGETLVYFAAQYHKPQETWTAISKTPYLTALAIWPGFGAWGGGGLFADNKTLGLNHASLERMVPSTSKPPSWDPLGPAPSYLPKLPISVKPLWEQAGKGEDSPIQHMRMLRDGWDVISHGDAYPHGSKEGYSWLLSDPQIFERACPVKRAGVLLRRRLKGVGKRDGRWYDEDFEVVRIKDGAVVRLIEGCTWADWYQKGDLLFAHKGCLYRLPRDQAGNEATNPTDGATCVADLNDMTFCEVPPPHWALRWHR